MNQFERAISEGAVRCDICRSIMLPMYGGGFDNDRLVCAAINSCGAEITYPTSTEPPSKPIERSHA